MKTLLPVLFNAMTVFAQPPHPGSPSPFGPPPGPPVTGNPFSGTETLQGERTLPDGIQVAINDQTKIYRDSSGRVRTETTVSAPQARTMITIVDPVAGFVTRLNPAASIAIKSPLPVNAPAPPAPPNTQSQDLGAKLINGLSATGTRTSFTTADGATVVREVWTSPDLLTPVEITMSDPHGGTTTMQLTSVSRGEPDGSLFQVPANYTVSTRTRPGPAFDQ